MTDNSAVGVTLCARSVQERSEPHNGALCRFSECSERLQDVRTTSLALVHGFRAER